MAMSCERNPAPWVWCMANWKITIFLKVNQRTKWQFPISYVSHYQSVSHDNPVLSSASTVVITMSDQWI